MNVVFFYRKGLIERIYHITSEQIDINQKFHNFASTLFRYEDTAKKKLVSNQYFHTQIEFRNKAEIS